MARYRAGNLVAFINKFQRSGHIVLIDEKGGGYKINTGHDIIYAYENEIVLMSNDAPIRPMEASKKIQRVAEAENLSSSTSNTLIEYVKQGCSETANILANYIIPVSDQVLASFLRAINNSKIDIREINFNIGINNQYNIKKIDAAVIKTLLPQEEDE